MTVQQMLNSLPVLERMLELKMPIKIAHKVYSLAKAINEQREFFIKEEKKLIETCGAEILPEGGIQFNSAENQTKFIEEHATLMNYEVELESITLSLDDLKDAEFTAKELIILEGVINFKE